MNTLDTIDENQKEKDSLIADLPVITAEDQAQSTLDNSSSQIEVETEDSGPGYPNPQYGRSSVDLSNPEAEKQMWEEYNEWWNLGRTRKWGVIPITDPEFKDERNRLRALGVLIKPPGTGLLIRTEADAISEDLLIDDLEALLKQWEAIQQASTTCTPPTLLNRDEDFIHRVLRDHANSDLSEVIVETTQASERANKFLDQNNTKVTVEDQEIY